MASTRGFCVRAMVLALAVAVMTALLCAGGSALADDGAGSGGGFLAASDPVYSLKADGGPAVALGADTEGDLTDEMPVSGSCGDQGDNVTYVFDDDGVLTISGTGAIAEGAFAGNDAIKQVVVGEGVTAVGASSFADCAALVSATLPSSLESVGAGAFFSCQSLAGIDIPAGVTDIGASAFEECMGLRAIAIPEGVTSIGPYSFADCYALESVSLPSTIVSIGECAFGACLKLAGISIPVNVTTIGDWAFNSCISLQYITIPASVESIGEYAFAYCSSATISVDPGNVVYDSRGGCGALVETATNTLLAGSALSGIPETVTAIAPSAFAEPYGIEEWLQEMGLEGITYSQLTGIEIPSSVTSIGESAFYGCAGLESVALPAGLESIGSNAFSSCTALKAIDIPTGVTLIGEYAFNYCQSLESATLPASITSIPGGAFRDCTALQSVSIPAGVESIGDSAFRGCAVLTQVFIPEGVTSIGAYAFSSCTGLASVSIPISMAAIGSGAFENTTATINYAGSRTQWAAITGSGKPSEPASYGSLSVTFDTGGGSAIATQNVLPGEKATKPAEDPVKDWCQFVGWYADDELQTEFDFQNTEITEDIIVYAKWYAACTVTLNSCGGSAVEAQHVWPGEKAVRPAEDPTKDGREFVGWYADGGYTTSFDFDTPITADITIYAKWRFPGGEDDPDGGYAYAKFDSGTGTFTFFRSWDEYFTDQIEIYVDDVGVEQAITYYAGIETTAYNGNNAANYAPWCKKISGKVKSVIFSCEIAPISTATWFYDMGNLETILGIERLDTSNVTSMFRMFDGCSKLTELDVSHMEVDKVTTFGQMFYGCSGLSTLDVSGWKTSSAIGMFDMFLGCSGLTSIDVSNFDTSHVVATGGMFSGCRNLASLDLSSFRTPNLESMLNMFARCTSLTSLDLSSFDTSNVTNMGGLLFDCSGLTEVDLSSFNTSNVTNMHSMFSGCESLTKVDLSGFDTSNVVDMGYMFMSCYSLLEVDLTGFNTDKVTEMRYMFSGCSELTSLDLSRFNTDNVNLMQAMFMNCNKLERLDISHLNTSKANAAGKTLSMLGGCNSLQEIRLGADTLFAADAGLPVGQWQLADLGDTSVRYESLSEYDGSRPGWYVQGYGDLSIEGVEDVAYTGAPIEQALTVSVGEHALVKDVDYTVSHQDNTNVGDAAVTVAGAGIWTGSASRAFTIAVKKVSPTVALSRASFTYDGKAKTPAVTVRDGSIVLAKGADYDVVYPSGRTNAGAYVVKVTLKGNYSGAGSASFKIAQAANTLSAKAKSKKAVIVKASKLQKKAVKIARKKALVVSSAKGAPTYELASAKMGKRSFKKSFKVAAKTGKITVKKGLKVGTYKLKVKVTASGDANHLPATKMVAVKVKVK